MIPFRTHYGGSLSSIQGLWEPRPGKEELCLKGRVKVCHVEKEENRTPSRRNSRGKGWEAWGDAEEGRIGRTRSQMNGAVKGREVSGCVPAWTVVLLTQMGDTEGGLGDEPESGPMGWDVLLASSTWQEESGPGRTHEFESLQGVVGTVGVSGITGGCGVKRELG